MIDRSLTYSALPHHTSRKIFDCKKCPVHLVSFIKHHGLFVPYIVDIFDCKKCHTHLVSLTKRHGLFVPYIVAKFLFLIRKCWLSPSYMSPNPRIQEYLFHILDPSNDNVPYLVSIYLSFLSVHMIKFNGLVYVTIIVINSTHTTINHPSQAMPTHMERTTVPRSIL